MKIVGCFLEYEGKFVILLRHNHKPNGGTWGLPAGKVESGEESQAAMLRELREETGYVATTSELVHIGDFTFGEKNNMYTFVAYKVSLSKPYKMVTEDVAHADYKWVTGPECFAIPNLIPDLHDLLKLVGYVK